MGTCYKALNRIFDAIQQFDKALEIKNNFSLAYFNKGMAYSTLKGDENLKIAINLLDLAIKYQEDYYDAHFNKGCILMDLGEYSEAIEVFNKCKELKGEDEEGINECEEKIRECGIRMNEGGNQKKEIEEREDEEEYEESQQ